MLRISNDLSLPLEAVMKQHFIVGQSSSGKTNLAVVLVEEFAKAHQQFVVIDEPGVWWGLRSSRDGKGEGLDVFLLGGEHGDMRLEPTSGAIVADFVVKSGHSFVLDLSLMKRAQWSQFMLDFCTRLYEAKATNKLPLHVVVDEADLFCPETPQEKTTGKPLLEMMDNMARRGRSRGIRMTFSTQRPQTINKSIIAQSDMLHVFRLSHPLDRSALDSWVRGNATPEEIKTFSSELASLDRGYCFAWSPQWLKIFKKVHIRYRETFDSSVTPEVGAKAVKPRVMRKVDIDGLKAQISASIETAKAEDPALLREEIKKRDSRISELERKIEAAKVSTEPKRIEVVPPGLVAEIRRAEELLSPLGSFIRNALPEGAFINNARSPSPTVARPFATTTRDMTSGEVKLRAGERRMVEVLAMYHPKALSRTQLGTLCGIIGSGTTFGTYLGTLRRVAFVEPGEPLRLTKAGLQQASHVSRTPLSRDEVVSLWMPKLRAGERKMFEALLKRRSLTREQLGSIAEIDPAGTTFGTYLGTLKRNDIAVVQGSALTDAVALAPTFVEAR